jgi:hypothetical protein
MTLIFRLSGKIKSSAEIDKRPGLRCPNLKFGAFQHIPDELGIKISH